MAVDKRVGDQRYVELDEAYDALIKALQVQRRETSGRSKGMKRHPHEAGGTVVVLSEARSVVKWLLVTEIDLMKRERGVTWEVVGEVWEPTTNRTGAQARWAKLRKGARLELSRLQVATHVLRVLNRRRDDEAKYGTWDS